MSGDSHEYRHDNPIQTYVEASVRTSTRSREILILIIIVSVLVFGSFWNSREHSWINERIAIHSKALEFAKSHPEAGQPNKLSLADLAGSIKGNHDIASFLAKRPYLRDRKSIEDALARLQNVKTDHVLYLKLPFFGIVIDVNDLGMVGGFALFVLLVWFRSSLWHEATNLRLTIKEAGASRQYYETLAMQQVLTTPPVLDRKGKPAIRWSGIVIVLTILPLLVQFAVVWNDLHSWDVGETVSINNTRIAIVAGSAFFVAILVFTIMCFVQLAEIVKAWQDFADSVPKNNGRAEAPANSRRT